MKNNKEHNNSEDQAFEFELFNSLKSYGYLFPENTQDVVKFEELYGNTDIEIPSNIKLPSHEDILKLKGVDFEVPMDIAAFISDEDTLPEDMPDNNLNNDSKQPEEGSENTNS